MTTRLIWELPLCSFACKTSWVIQKSLHFVILYTFPRDRACLSWLFGLPQFSSEATPSAPPDIFFINKNKICNLPDLLFFSQNSIKFSLSLLLSLFKIYFIKKTNNSWNGPSFPRKTWCPTWDTSKFPVALLILTPNINHWESHQVWDE